MSVQEAADHLDSLAAWLADRAAAYPQRTAFVTGDVRKTWIEIEDHVSRRAAALLACGVAAGDRVAVLAGQTRANVEFMMALSWAGVTAVPINTRLSAAEMFGVLQSADVAALAFEPDFAPQSEIAAEAVGISRRHVVLDEAPEIAPTVRHVWAPQQLATILFTGGTTGLPKGVMLSAQALLMQGLTVHEALAYDEDTIVLQAQPIFHIAGVNQLYAAAMAAATIVFRADAGPVATYEEVARNGVNSIGAVPTTLAMLIDHPDRDDALLARIRSVVYGAAPISSGLLARVAAAMPGARFCQLYGQTETGPITALLPQHHDLDGPWGVSKLNSAGRARPHYVVRTSDEDGVNVPLGQPGEILVQGPAATDGYWRDPERTAELFRDGWLRTGDAGVLDEDGFLKIVDRYKDMIVTGGENVFSAEVENTLSLHEAVASCAVFGVPDEFWGEAVRAAVILKPDRTVAEDELIAFCRDRIAGFKCPKSIEIRTTPLPLSAVGKVLKHILRAEAVAKTAA